MSSLTTSTTITSKTVPGKVKTISWLDMPPCRWTDSELSIGQRCESLDPLRRYKCWTLLDKSPAHCVWKLISKPITLLIHDQFEHLETKGCDIMIDMFMIGRKPTNASPTILIRCETKVSREKAMGLIEKKALLAEYPGVRMAQCSKFPRLLALGDDEKEFTSVEGVYVDGPVTSCGLPISIVGRDDTAPRKATLGGFVFVTGIPFGLTAAHAFLPNNKSQIEEHAYEFSFYRDDNFSASDEDLDIEEITSKGASS
jgi:hypothetical protein